MGIHLSKHCCPDLLHHLSSPMSMYLLLPLLSLTLLPSLSLTHTCCDDPQTGCFASHCDSECSYLPCQDLPCNGDSLGQMWCSTKEGVRVTEIGWGWCGASYATYKGCSCPVESWEAGQQDIWGPKCEKNGLYQEKQCEKDRCWCVDQVTGMEKGTDCLKTN